MTRLSEHGRTTVPFSVNVRLNSSAVVGDEVHEFASVTKREHFK